MGASVRSVFCAVVLVSLLAACEETPEPPRNTAAAATAPVRTETAAVVATPEPTPEPAPVPTLEPAPEPTPPPAPPVAVASITTSPQIAPRDATRIAPLPLSNAVRTVVLDPGHGADEVGAAANGVVEKHSNLEMAMRVEGLLVQHGVRVLLTRRTDERAFTGTPIGGYSATRRDLQARIDLANESGADIFVSLHSNGAGSTAERGIETYYNSQRPFAGLNYALASILQSTVVSEMRAAGYSALDRGVKDDACLKAFQGRCFPLFVLGPARTTSREEVIARGGSPEALGMAPGEPSTSSRPTNMPGALLELLFITNASDAALLGNGDARDTIARGIARGIIDYLNQHQ